MEYSNLNEKQKEAVCATEGPVMIIAGAGSGKTRVLTLRVSYIVKELGIAPFKVLGFTFTNKAANEMKTRVANYLSGLQINWIGTFHGICLRFLKEEIQTLGRASTFSVIDEEDQKAIVNKLLKENNVFHNMRINKIIECISSIKNLLIDNKTLQDSKHFQKIMEELGIYTIEDLKIIRFIFPKYCEHLMLLNYVDYDDLILMTHKILKENIEIQKKWQSRFEYVLVDEFQDTNKIQFELLNFFVDQSKKNVFVVGDPDQTIYTWRGAYANIFEDFLALYKNTKQIILDKNYRSTKNILSGANKLISRNTNRIDKCLVTDNESGEKITIYGGRTQYDEGRFVAEKIKQLVSEKKCNYKDIAILYRSNYLSRFVEEVLVENGIPYKIYGGIKFYQRAEIKDLISYLKLCVNINDEVSLRRIINTPKRSIGNQTIETIAKHAFESGTLFNEAFLKCSIDQSLSWAKTNAVTLANLLIRMNENKTMLASEIIEKIIKAIDYDSYLKTLENYESRKENVQELIDNIKRFELKEKNNTLADYLQEISLYTEPNEGLENNLNTCTLMTIHAAKGTEYFGVFVVGVNEGIFPSRRPDCDISEERRIAYVALTRAKKILNVSYSNDYSYVINGELIASRFVDEIGNDVNIHNPNTVKKINFIKNNFSNVYSGVGVFLGDIVSHQIFGCGVVIRINGQFADIQFPQPHGIKTLIKNHTSLKKVNN